ncbi:MAG: glycosyltransferase [Thermodesulfobacteriota bacterium]|nr:glycosyltransferase [Thermodesulfobacteriota bacterium]
MKEKYIAARDDSLPILGTIHRVGIYPPYPIKKDSLLKRIWNRLWEDYLCLVDPYSGWILPAFIKGLRVIKKNKIDLIMATGPPVSSMVIGCLLNIMTKTKLILDYRDPWSNQNWGYKKIFRKKFNQFFEKLAISRASALVFCSRIMMENFRDSLGKYTKATCHVVTNGFYSRDTIEPLSLGNGRRNMVYAGKFYGEREIGLLIKPLFYLLNQGTINKNNFCCYIFGSLTNENREVIKKYRLNEIIKEQPMVSYEKILRYLKGADILFLPSGSEFRYAIPFKFYDYLSVKRPILAVAPENSAVAEMMSQIDCGRLALINSEESILKNLRKMFSTEEEYAHSGSEQYTWDKIGDKYIAVLEGIR